MFKVPLFALLDDEEAAVLASQVELMTFAPRERIYKVGDSGAEAYSEGSLYSLTHWDGDTSVYRYKGEPGAMTRGVKFTLGDRPEVLVENLAEEGRGTFTKVGP